MASNTMMQEKWTVAFKLLDFNKDGMISSLDRDECKKSFASVYQVTGQESDTMLAELDSFWNKSVFLGQTPDWSKSFTPNDMLKTRQESFDTNPSGTVEIVREAMAHLVRAADTKDAKKFNFEEFKRAHKAFGQDNDSLIQGIFAMAGPEGGTCSSDAIVEFYTELTIGSDVPKHEQYKSALASVGFL